MSRRATLAGIIGALLPFFAVAAGAQQRMSQPFPVILVDSAVRARLVEEWDANNRYQHERAYCVRYSADVRAPTQFNPSVVVYTLKSITRARETGHTENGVASADCGKDSTTMLHIHTPAHCEESDSGSSCSIWSDYAHQCFPSPLDVAGLIKGSQPFELIQCADWAIVPFFRRLYAN